jgi:signal transduction histidine kinase
MPADVNPSRCFLIASFDDEVKPLLRHIRSGARDAGFEVVYSEEPQGIDLQSGDRTLSELVRADIVLALVSHPSGRVLYEMGQVQALGKPAILLFDQEKGAVPWLSAGTLLPYTSSEEGLPKLQSSIRRLLEGFRRNPRQFQAPLRVGNRPSVLPVVDLERLGPREFENLCFELLTQMGFRRVEWGKELKEVDVVATLPKKDPDGFEYQELWLISMGLHAPQELLFDFVEPDFILRKLISSPFADRFRASFKTDSPITLLLILSQGTPPEIFDRELRRMEGRLSERRLPFKFRLRTWDRQYLTNLIQQYPQIAFKYFSEEGRYQSKSRKTTEELYRETVGLNEKLQAANDTLREEREKRVRAERDAVWKDVAFKAAHKLGNPVFALETYLQGLNRRIKSKPDEALEVAGEMGASIEKAKGIIEQFKSLTRAQEISKRPVELVPLIQGASRVAVESGVEVKVEAPHGSPPVSADPTRMTECFDELFANALHWLDKPDKKISAIIDVPKRTERPAELDQKKGYVRVRFEDNGRGVPVGKKKEIFAPFYTTSPHGTGLGLSMVERIIEGHEGLIRETGKPGDGAVFEIFLPQSKRKSKEE